MEFDKITAFVRRDFLIESSYRFHFGLRIARIIVSLLVYYFLSAMVGRLPALERMAPGTSYFAFVIIGVALLEYLVNSLNSLSDMIRQEQTTGTFEAILVSPTMLTTLIIGEVLWNFIFNSSVIVVYIILAGVFFGLDLSRMNIVLCASVFALTTLATLGLGIICAAFIIRLKKGDPLSWCLVMSTALWSGVYYPVDILPPVMRYISYCIPFTYSVHAFRQAVLFGADWRQIAPDLVMLGVFAVVFIPLGIFIFSAMLKREKVAASLGHY